MTAYGYPSVTEVKPLDDYLLLLCFENGEQRIFDAKPMLAGMEGKWLGELLDRQYFKMVRVNDGIVNWPHEQDICPDCIYEDSKPVLNEPDRLKAADMIIADLQNAVHRSDKEGWLTDEELENCY